MTSMNNSSFLLLAQAESLKSIHNHKIGCVLVKSSRVLATGFNQVRLKSIGLRYTRWISSLHAERDCLSKLDKELIPGTTLYIYREDKSGKSALARPCSQCRYMLEELGVKKIVYTIDKFPYYIKEKL